MNIYETTKLTEKQKLLVEENLHVPTLVTYRFKKMQGSSFKIDTEDALAYANLELIKAAMTFDETRGVKFSTYATTVILNKLKNVNASLSKEQAVESSFESEANAEPLRKYIQTNHVSFDDSQIPFKPLEEEINKLYGTKLPLARFFSFVAQGYSIKDASEMVKTDPRKIYSLMKRIRKDKSLNKKGVEHIKNLITGEAAC